MGLQTWSLQQSLLDKLEVFLHWSIQRILAINITHVKEERIWNTTNWNIFYDIPDVEYMIAARQLDFIRKAIQGPHDQPSWCMTTECCDHQWQVWCPQTHKKTPWYKSYNFFLLESPLPPLIALACLRNGSMRYLTRYIGLLLSTVCSTLMPPSLSNQQHGDQHHIIAVESLPHLFYLPLIGPTTNQMPNSPQHHHTNAPPLPPLNLPPSQPPHHPLHLTQNVGWMTLFSLTKLDKACPMPLRSLGLDLVHQKFRQRYDTDRWPENTTQTNTIRKWRVWQRLRHWTSLNCWTMPTCSFKGDYKQNTTCPTCDECGEKLCLCAPPEEKCVMCGLPLTHVVSFLWHFLNMFPRENCKIQKSFLTGSSMFKPASL